MLVHILFNVVWKKNVQTWGVLRTSKKWSMCCSNGDFQWEIFQSGWWLTYPSEKYDWNIYIYGMLMGYIWTINGILLAGWWLSHPSEKWWSESQLGLWFPTEWRNNTCSKPPTSQRWRIWDVQPGIWTTRGGIKKPRCAIGLGLSSPGE